MFSRAVILIFFLIEALHYFPTVLLKSLLVPGFDAIQDLRILCCADFILILI